MICPHCNYKHGFYFDENDEYVNVLGERGEFYRLSVQVERDLPYICADSKYLYACPNCGKTFIEV